MEMKGQVTAERVDADGEDLLKCEPMNTGRRAELPVPPEYACCHNNGCSEAHRAEPGTAMIQPLVSG